MKLSLEINLDARRDVARSAIAGETAERIRLSSALEPLYALKRRLAEERLLGHAPADLLTQEAKLRGIDTLDLARQIVARALENDDAITQLELARQQALDALKASSNAPEIEKIVALFVAKARG